jgi:D-tyrosyl-tRNA(Tyr) deacylase
VQRVARASVTVEGECVGAIGPGLAVLVGVKEGDTEADAEYIADKVAGLRVFDDAEGRMNLAAAEVGAGVLVISQFTLYGDARKGRRPSYARAARPDVAQQLYEACARQVAARGLPVATGVFGAEMIVSLENDGPVTVLLDSERLF